MYGEMIDEMDSWANELEQVFVNGELQVIASELKEEVVDQQWEDLVGVQFLTFAPEEEYYE